jgi:hypothetical protein
VKRQVTGTSDKQWVAAIVLNELSKSFDQSKKSLLYQLRKQEDEVEYRTAKDVTQDIQDITVRMHHNGTFVKQESRKVVHTILNSKDSTTGEIITLQYGAHTLVTEGKRRVKAYADALLEGGVPDFPSRVFIDQREELQKIESAKAAQVKRGITIARKKAAKLALENQMVDNADNLTVEQFRDFDVEVNQMQAELLELEKDMTTEDDSQDFDIAYIEGTFDDDD